MLDDNIKTKNCPQNICETNYDYDVIISLDSRSTLTLLSEITSRYEPDRTEDRLIHFVHFPVKDELVEIKNACHHVTALAFMVRELIFCTVLTNRIKHKFYL